MVRYILGRLLALGPIILGVAALVFIALRVVPGDAATVQAGLEGDKERTEALRVQMGLDRPLVVQFVEWAGQLAKGNLGQSLQSGRPVAQEIAERLPPTIFLTSGAMVLAVLLAIPLGVISAVRRNSLLDLLLRGFGLVGLSMPNFWFAVLLILGFSLYWPLLPPAGYAPFLRQPFSSLQYLVLPALASALPVLAVIMRMTRSAMLEVLREDYIRTARAKGLSERRVLYRHTLRNAGINIITTIGMQVGQLVGGSVAIETIFGWPGVGYLAFRGISQRDYPVVQGVVLATALLGSLVTLLVDVLYTYTDPRIQYD